MIPQGDLAKDIRDVLASIAKEAIGREPGVSIEVFDAGGRVRINTNDDEYDSVIRRGRDEDQGDVERLVEDAENGL
ncbi:hypothetical protein HQ563_02990 [bacterium]|nr:hypothetical protein [bacterium]